LLLDMAKEAGQLAFFVPGVRCTLLLFACSLEHSAALLTTELLPLLLLLLQEAAARGV
jgi:hypothetical protein